MKLKTDFVTNSSSTAYVVLIPKNFHISEDDIEITWGSVDEEEEITAELIKRETIELINDLKDGDSIWYYGFDGVHPEIYNTVLEVCEKNKFILSTKDLNGEGNNMIQGIEEEKIKEIIFNSINLEETFNFLKKERKR